MEETDAHPRCRAFAIVPSNDLAAAVAFWQRLGFSRSGGDAQYNIMTGWNCEVHLTQACEGPWRVPESHNPFGVSSARRMSMLSPRASTI